MLIIPGRNAMETECPVCLETVTDVYTINCDASHKICDSCEGAWRLKMPITGQGVPSRVLKCPLCRGEEPVPGDRSKLSLQMELNSVYSQLVHRPFVPHPSSLEGIVMRIIQTPSMRPIIERFQLLQERIQTVRSVPVPPVPQVSHVSRQREWCQSGRRELDQCPTKGKTIRKCTFRGCNRNVCRSCKMCSSH